MRLGSLTIQVWDQQMVRCLLQSDVPRLSFLFLNAPYTRALIKKESLFSSQEVMSPKVYSRAGLPPNHLYFYLGLVLSNEGLLICLVAIILDSTYLDLRKPVS